MLTDVETLDAILILVFITNAINLFFIASSLRRLRKELIGESVIVTQVQEVPANGK